MITRHAFVCALLASMLVFAGASPRGMAQEPRVESARDLLDLLERADEDLAAITARVQYDRRFRLQGDRHVRRGSLYFLVENPGAARPNRSFAIDFELLIVGDRREEDPESWIFDGQWLIEKRPSDRQFIKRRIAPPNADFDPLRIGEGPMPIPIGQRAGDILARYEAELRDPYELFQGDGAAGLREFVRGTKQIRLTPRPAFEEQEDLKEIRLWYRWDEESGRFLPRLARTVNRAGDESYVQLINVQVQEVGDPALAIPSDAFETEPPRGEGWDVQVIDDLQGGEPRG
jgi:hypothetical protein